MPVLDFWHSLLAIQRVKEQQTKSPRPKKAESFFGKGIYVPVSPMEYPAENSRNIDLLIDLLIWFVALPNTKKKHMKKTQGTRMP